MTEHGLILQLLSISFESLCVTSKEKGRCGAGSRSHPLPLTRCAALEQDI